MPLPAPRARGVCRDHLQLRLVIIQFKRDLHLAQIFRVQAQLRSLLPLLSEQRDVLAQGLLPFVSTPAGCLTPARWQR